MPLSLAGTLYSISGSVNHLTSAFQKDGTAGSLPPHCFWHPWTWAWLVSERGHRLLSQPNKEHQQGADHVWMSMSICRSDSRYIRSENYPHLVHIFKLYYQLRYNWILFNCKSKTDIWWILFLCKNNYQGVSYCRLEKHVEGTAWEY